MDKKELQGVFNAIEAADNHLTIARSRLERLLGVGTKMKRTNGAAKTPPSFGPPVQDGGEKEDEEFDLETASRKELVRMCHELGYGEADTKGRRVQTLRDMITSAQEAGDEEENEPEEIPVKPPVPRFKAPPKAFKPPRARLA